MQSIAYDIMCVIGSGAAGSLVAPGNIHPPENTPPYPLIVIAARIGPSQRVDAAPLPYQRTPPQRPSAGHPMASAAHAVGYRSLPAPDPGRDGTVRRHRDPCRPHLPPTPRLAATAPPAPYMICRSLTHHTPHTNTPTPKNPRKWFKNDISLGKHRAETPMGVANRPRHISQMAPKQYYTASS